MVVKLGTFTICDGGIPSGSRELPQDLEVDCARSPEVAKFLRANGIQAFARGNKITTISFGVTREHAAYSDAEGFVLSHDLSVPEQGDLVITQSFSDGSFTFTLKNAATVRCTTKHKGVTTMTKYQFIGGLIT